MFSALGLITYQIVVYLNGPPCEIPQNCTKQYSYYVPTRLDNGLAQNNLMLSSSILVPKPLSILFLIIFKRI